MVKNFNIAGPELSILPELLRQKANASRRPRSNNFLAALDGEAMAVMMQGICLMKSWPFCYFFFILFQVHVLSDCYVFCAFHNGCLFWFKTTASLHTKALLKFSVTKGP
jgi:hypothetical protein